MVNKELITDWELTEEGYIHLYDETGNEVDKIFVDDLVNFWLEN